MYSFNQLQKEFGRNNIVRVCIRPDGQIRPLPHDKFPIDDFKTVEKLMLELGAFEGSGHNQDELTIWQPVRINSGHVMYVNDDGYYLKLPYNPQATALYHESNPSVGTAILGPAFILHNLDVL